MIDISIVIPLYNEIENIPHLAEKLNNDLSSLNKSYEIVIVDDGSTDGSWEKLLEVSRQYPYFKLIRFRRNFGQTAATSAGFKNSSGDIIITMDADLQNDPADIPKLLEIMDQGADVVSGWRKDRKDAFLTRCLPSMMANRLISKITGVYLHDYGCTLKAYRKEIVDNLRLYGEMHRFIPAMASWVGGTIKEVVVSHNPRRFGTSKYGVSRTIRVILDLMTVKFLLRYSAHPMQIFGKIGMIFGMPGLLMLIAMLFAHIGYNFLGMDFMGALVETSKRPAWIIPPFMLIIFGTQFVIMGLLAEIQIRTYHESQDKPTYVIKEIVEG